MQNRIMTKKMLKNPLKILYCSNILNLLKIKIFKKKLEQIKFQELWLSLSWNSRLLFAT
jgi:hypothetical protein